MELLNEISILEDRPVLFVLQSVGKLFTSPSFTGHNSHIISNVLLTRSDFTSSTDIYFAA